MSITREELVTFLSNHTRADLSDVEDSTELFSTGLVDSFAMVELLMLLEKALPGKVGPDDISVDNLDSIERILSFVESRR